MGDLGSTRSEADGDSRFTKMATTTVGPATPTQRHWLPLSNADQIPPHYYTPLLVLYNAECVAGNVGTPARAVEKLKDSLARVLVHFYPMAGRLRLREQGPQIYCNDAGVVFLEAYEDADLCDVVPVNKCEGDPLLSGVQAVMDELSAGSGSFYDAGSIDIPVCIVQVTFFKCGGMALAGNWHHMVCDGFSGTHFMKAWAEESRGSKISLLPNHDRWLLKSRHPPTPPHTTPVVLSSPTSVESHSTLEKRTSEHAHAGPKGSEMVKSTLRGFEFTKEQIDKLKFTATNGGKEGPFSSVECLSAHLWKSVTKARRTLKPSVPVTEEIGYHVAVDLRKRMGLPTGYFGNVVFIASSSTTVEMLLSKPLGFAAGLIHDSLTAMTGEAYASILDWVELHKLGSKVHVTLPSSKYGRDLLTSSWRWFPILELDYGWGRPFYAVRNSEPTSPALDGKFFMQPSASASENVTISLHLPANVLEALEADPSFHIT